MEMRDLLRIIKRYKYFVILSTLLFGVVALIISYNLPATFTASTVIYVRGRAETPSSDFFTYEGFYSQQTAKEFTDTVVGLSKSQDITKKALEALGRSSDIRDIKEIQGALSVRKTAPQLVKLTVNRPDVQEAEEIVKALVQAVSERVTELNKESGILVSVQSIDSTPIVEEQKPFVALNTLVAVLAGLVLSLVGISIREYLKEENFQLSENTWAV